MIAGIIARIIARVPQLAGRVSGAAGLSAAMANPGTLSRTPYVFVMPGPLRGQEPMSYGPLTIQPVLRGVDLVLFYNTHDATGARALDDMGDLVDALAGALIGWAEVETDPAWRLGDGRMLRFDVGVAAYQLPFTRDDNLRITV